MATGSKRGAASAKKRGAYKSNYKKTGTRQGKSRQGNDDSVMDEVALLIVLAVSVLLFLSDLKLIGSFGKAVSGVMFGLFGLAAFIVPFVIFFAGAFIISNKGLGIAGARTAAYAGLIIIICAFCHLFAMGDYSGVRFNEFYSICADERTGGGILGSMTAMALVKTIGKVGTYIVLVALAIICGVIITEKSFIGGIRKGSKSIYDKSREGAKRHHEVRAIRHEEARTERELRNRERAVRREELREERMEALKEREEALSERKKRRSEMKVSGVMMNTKLSEPEAFAASPAEAEAQDDAFIQDNKEALGLNTENAHDIENRAEQLSEPSGTQEKERTGQPLVETAREATESEGASIAALAGADDFHEISVEEISNIEDIRDLKREERIRSLHTEALDVVNFRNSHHISIGRDIREAAVIFDGQSSMPEENGRMPAQPAEVVPIRRGGAEEAGLKEKGYLTHTSDYGNNSEGQTGAYDEEEMDLSRLLESMTPKRGEEIFVSGLSDISDLLPNAVSYRDSGEESGNGIESETLTAPENALLYGNGIETETMTPPENAPLYGNGIDTGLLTAEENPSHLEAEVTKEPEKAFDRAFDSTGDHENGRRAEAEKASESSASFGGTFKEEKKEASEVIEKEPVREYVLPSTELLDGPNKDCTGDSMDELWETAGKLKDVLKTFGVNVTMKEISQGPTVTRFEMQPETGVKVSKILSLSDDIKLNMAATDVRIEAPIPGKPAIGIEIPNKTPIPVNFKELVTDEAFKKASSSVSFAVGKDIEGRVVVTDIAKMPHLLIAGATGSGKSVCINTLIMSILYKADPEDVKLIMIDPKVVELSVYNGIPHLLIPVVTDPKKASAALQWGVAEMDERYNKFAEYKVRDMKGFNRLISSSEFMDIPENERPKKMPQIVIIVDELADLMMVASKEVEESICRIAQKARAAGIHLVIATQRPSVDVITGLIKANMPSRIAFSVSSGTDSRTILDMVGAEKLLGKGDMLFYPQGYSKPARLQGAFISDEEVTRVVNALKEQTEGENYDDRVISRMDSVASESGGASGLSMGSENNGNDEFFEKAARFIIDKDKASIGMLQRAFKIGFNRAARIMDQLAEAGVVGEEEGTKPRKILMSSEQFDQYVEEYL